MGSDGKKKSIRDFSGPIRTTEGEIKKGLQVIDFLATL